MAGPLEIFDFRAEMLRVWYGMIYFYDPVVQIYEGSS